MVANLLTCASALEVTGPNRPASLERSGASPELWRLSGRRTPFWLFGEVDVSLIPPERYSLASALYQILGEHVLLATVR